MLEFNKEEFSSIRTFKLCLSDVEDIYFFKDNQCIELYFEVDILKDDFKVIARKKANEIAKEHKKQYKYSVLSLKKDKYNNECELLHSKLTKKFN